MLAWGFILLGSLACLGAAHPISSDVEPQWLLRERRSPMAARTMILIRGQPSSGGYNYDRPERAFNPHAGMAAYATGGTVAAGSFYGAPTKKQKCGDCNNEQPEEDRSTPESPEEEETPAEEEPSKAPEVPQRKAKSPKAAKRPPTVEDEDDDEEDEDDSVARKGGRPGGSVYRNFFPMTFAAAGRSRARAGEDEEGGEGSQGSVTAIANSFSKGRGAIASSSAVAHGSPDASQTRQSQPSRYRARQ